MTFNPDAKNIYFLPLGGVGEIGMNMSLYGHAGQWLMVDCGVSFANADLPGIDILMADPRFIAEQPEKLSGLVLTHGHEDHLGAVEYLWNKLRCPIYATPFTAELLRHKLADSRGQKKKAKIFEIPVGGSFGCGPFDLKFINMTHSIPESQALLLSTPVGSVLHTGDWKLDPNPMIGDITDSAALQALAQQDLLALIGDSTNALVPGRAGSEQEAAEGLTEIFTHCRQRIVVTCFASNVARVQSAIIAARRNGRHAALVGRSLWRIWEVAQMTGYLNDLEPPLTEHEAAHAPRDQIVLICTGSQGEPRSALSKLADDDHPDVQLEAGDVCIFSSREIPGNETAIAGVQNRLIRRGIGIITADDAKVHVSGHPCRDELAEMYQWTRPRLAVPVHGEPRHQRAHAEVARRCQVPKILIPENGEIICLGPSEPKVAGTAPSGILAMDGTQLRPLRQDAGALRERQKLSVAGLVTITLALTRRGEILDVPQISLLGLVEPEELAPMLLELEDVVQDAVDKMDKGQGREDAAMQSRIGQQVRRHFNQTHGKKPMVQVHIVRV